MALVLDFRELTMPFHDVHSIELSLSLTDLLWADRSRGYGTFGQSLLVQRHSLVIIASRLLLPSRIISQLYVILIELHVMALFVRSICRQARWGLILLLSSLTVTIMRLFFAGIGFEETGGSAACMMLNLTNGILCLSIIVITLSRLSITMMPVV